MSGGEVRLWENDSVKRGDGNWLGGLLLVGGDAGYIKMTMVRLAAWVVARPSTEPAMTDARPSESGADHSSAVPSAL